MKGCFLEILDGLTAHLRNPWDRTLDIASTWDKAKNGVRNGGAGRPRVARSDQHAESDRHHLDPTFDQVEGNSEKMQRGCAEKGFIRKKASFPGLDFRYDKRRPPTKSNPTERLS